jgi:hypothetical protein
MAASTENTRMIRRRAGVRAHLGGHAALASHRAGGGGHGAGNGSHLNARTDDVGIDGIKRQAEIRVVGALYVAHLHS